ncbi:MAG: sigma-54-dependent Fis family transcriptional regulator, partial [Polyangiaceae bacterium]|nr:sigma-54-dependent Fis family transcriptional regulator [Polyangiaceae bacterium]
SALGTSLSMRHVFEVLERASTSDVGVLLEGESGVGKEILAREVHAHSRRREGPFFVFDCGAVAPNLIESELFGHARGAFTGAVEARQGVFQRAHGGTLFLDEVGELDVALQPKLLRALEHREVTPVGGGAPIKVDVRIVAATNRRLGESVRKGEFRADLFYRLAVARIIVPPLRDRRDDIIPIARSFLRQALGDADAEIPRALEGLLLAYAWPGNVRELRNVIQRFAFLGARDAASLFDGATATAIEPELPYDIARQRAIEDFEARYVPSILARAGGSAAKAAQLAGVARQSFYRMLQRVRGPSPEGQED